MRSRACLAPLGHRTPIPYLFGKFSQVLYCYSHYCLTIAHWMQASGELMHKWATCAPSASLRPQKWTLAFISKSPRSSFTDPRSCASDRDNFACEFTTWIGFAFFRSNRLLRVGLCSYSGDRTRSTLQVLYHLGG